MSGEGDPGYGISILPLRHVSAQTLISLIDGFGARPGSVRAEKARNLLVILGDSADRKAAIDTALTFDADWMQDQSVAILPLQHTKPEAIIPELERIFASREGNVGADLVQFVPMQRLRAVLVVSPRNNVIDKARLWVRRLDTEDPDLTADVHVYRVKYRDATTLAGLLNGLFNGQGTTGATTANGQVEPGSQPITTQGMTSGFSQNGQGQSQSWARAKVRATISCRTTRIRTIRIRARGAKLGPDSRDRHKWRKRSHASHRRRAVGSGGAARRRCHASRRISRTTRW